MFAPALLTALLPLLPLALASPLEPRAAPEFNITSLNGRFPTDGNFGTGPIDSSLSITLSYPESATSDVVLTTTCRAAWPKTTPPGPTNWAPCDDPNLQWRLPEKGWTRDTNFRVEVYQALDSSDPTGPGLDATHYLVYNPANPNDPDGYLFCIQMGKLNPLTCTLTGPYGQFHGSVVMLASQESARPN